MAGRKSDFTLTKLDDLFSTQEQRDEEKLSKIRDIPLTEIDDFPDHPFKVRDDEDNAMFCTKNQQSSRHSKRPQKAICDYVVIRWPQVVINKEGALIHFGSMRTGICRLLVIHFI